MIRALREVLTWAILGVAILVLVLVGIPAAVHLGAILTPTEFPESSYAWSPLGLISQAIGQRMPMPASTMPLLFVFLGLVVALLWMVHATALTSNGLSSIIRLRFVVWWRSKPQRAPLTAKAARPLGRIGWFGFFGIRWFTDMLEETRILIAPTGAGKTVRVVVPLILRAQGPIVTTSTKSDVLMLTAWIRMMRHPFARVLVFDPEGLVLWMGKRRVKWDIIRGCEDEQMAMKRAAAIVAARPIDGSQSSNSGFFTQAVTIVLQCMMHAAACGGKSMKDVMKWMGNFEDDTPYDILANVDGANESWGHLLEKYCRGKADETVSSTDMSASGILNAFSIPSILAAVCPEPGDYVIDIARHHRTKDALYLICKGEDSPASSVFTALVESMYVLASDDVTRTEPCVPPFELILDEAMNNCAIPSLPRAQSTGRGEGIIPTLIIQDYQQLVSRYGESKAVTIVNNSTQLLVMGGLKDSDYLQKLSALAGTLDHLGRGFAKQILAPEKIRTLREGRAVLFYRNQPPAIITLPPWWRRREKDEYQASLEWAKNERDTYMTDAAFERAETERAA